MGEPRRGGLRSGGEHAADVDQVVGDDTEADPAFHAVGPFVATAIEAVPPLDDTDAPLTPGPPLLTVAEPALFLFALALRALGGSVRNADARDALRVRGRFIGARVERGV